MMAFADDEIRWQNNEVGAEQGIRSVDDAVIRPENLRQLDSVRGRHSATVDSVSTGHVAFCT